MMVCQHPGCDKLANLTGYCHEHEAVRTQKQSSSVKPIRDPRNAILAIMTGDHLKIGDSVAGTIVYEIVTIEGDSADAQIYLQDVQEIMPQRVIHYHRVD